MLVLVLVLPVTCGLGGAQQEILFAHNEPFEVHGVLLIRLDWPRQEKIQKTEQKDAGVDQGMPSLRADAAKVHKIAEGRVKDFRWMDGRCPRKINSLLVITYGPEDPEI